MFKFSKGILLFFLLGFFIFPVLAKADMVKASWYKTKNPRAAAHRIFPTGTKLLVRNPANGRKLILTVEGTGPFVKGRQLDVSREAARHLCFLEKGVTMLEVRVIVVD